MPDPTGAAPGRRAVQLIGIGSKGMLTLAILYLRPKSRGSIRIQNNDPLKIVLADEGFLANPEDMEAIKNIFRNYVKNIAAELEAIDSSYNLISPGPDVMDNDSKLEQYIKENFDHNHHQQSFLRMAPLQKGGVVDRRGNVHDVKNLIVADCSCFSYWLHNRTPVKAAN
ncbi:GMC family oxidoreductase [Paenibacillus sp. P25]|nr:GMC family oxidoreductase [Paenibacillus sp. P25]